MYCASTTIPKAVSVYCFHEIPEMTSQLFWPLTVSMPCQTGKTEAVFLFFQREETKAILTTTVLEKSCKIPYVDPATVSYLF